MLDAFCQCLFFVEVLQAFLTRKRATTEWYTHRPTLGRRPLAGQHWTDYVLKCSIMYAETLRLYIYEQRNLKFIPCSPPTPPAHLHRLLVLSLILPIVCSNKAVIPWMVTYVSNIEDLYRSLCIFCKDLQNKWLRKIDLFYGYTDCGFVTHKAPASLNKHICPIISNTKLLKCPSFFLNQWGLQT